MKKFLIILFFLPLFGYSQQWQLANSDLTIDISKNAGTVIHVGKWLATFSIIGDSVQFTYQRNNDNSHFILYFDKDSVTLPTVASATALYDTLLAWTIGEINFFDPAQCHEITRSDTFGSCSPLVFWSTEVNGSGNIPFTFNTENNLSDYQPIFQIQDSGINIFYVGPTADFGVNTFYTVKTSPGYVAANISTLTCDTGTSNGSAFLNDLYLNQNGDVGGAQAAGARVNLSFGGSSTTGVITGFDVAPAATTNGATISYYEGVSVDGFSNNATIDFAYGYYYGAISAGSGSINHNFGMQINDITGGTIENYAIYTGLGRARLGDTTSVESNLIVNGDISPNTAQTTVNASISGTAVFSEPLSGLSYKKIIVYLSATNGTASYTFPIAFSHTPAIVTTNQVAAGIVTALSTTAMTVTGTTTTGFLFIEGY